jgi:hypothetical protein
VAAAISRGTTTAGTAAVPANAARGASTAGSGATPALPAARGERGTKGPTSPAAAAASKDAPPSASAAKPAAPAAGASAPAAAAPSPAAPVAAAEPAPPAAASAPTESFGDIRAVVPGEGTKSRELDALLSLEPGKLVVRSRESGAVLKTLPYQAIAAATYVQSKRPKSSDSPNVAAVPENVAGSGFFLGTAKHWLTLQSPSDFLILRLDDKNVRAIMSSLESRTGIKTQRADQK